MLTVAMVTSRVLTWFFFLFLDVLLGQRRVHILHVGHLVVSGGGVDINGVCVLI